MGAEVVSVIRLTQVTMRYGKTVALDGVDLHVAPGETLGLLGPNGAGKTTALRLLAGMAPPAAGQVRVLSVDPWADPDRVRPRMGVLPEATGLFERLTVDQNLALFAGLYGLGRAHIARALAAAGAAHLPGRRVGRLSKGERQRVALARALLHEPELLILDEPTSGLDPAAAAAFHERIRELQSAGRTIVLASHDMAEVEALCDRVAILDRGRLVACDTPAALKARHSRRLVRVTVARGEGTASLEWPLEHPAWIEAAARHQAEGTLLAVHTAEASLAEVFLQATGRELRCD